MFCPLLVPQQLDGALTELLDKAGPISGPLEQSFFMLVHAPRLQPIAPEARRPAVHAIIVDELRRLHEGVLAGYGLRPLEFAPLGATSGEIRGWLQFLAKSASSPYAASAGSY